MGCEFSKPKREKKTDAKWTKRLRFWTYCTKETTVVPIRLEPPRIMKEIVFKDVEPSTPEPIDIAPPNVLVLESEMKRKSKEQSVQQRESDISDQPSTSADILADLRSSGIIVDSATPSGCSFEVPVTDAPSVKRKPPARLAKLIKAPKARKTKEQKKEELMAKLRNAEQRKEDLENKFYQRMREHNLRRETNKTVVDSNDDWSKCSLEAKILAKEAVAATLKQELLQEKLDKMKKREERRSKVLQKKRSGRIHSLKAKISRQNKVAPLIICEPAPTITQTSGDNSSGVKPLSGAASASAPAPKDYSNWDSMFGPLTN
ncbi:uncharacterized protein [Amphiura filiformis]|uniref:uncharacterized protein n=1 Tax=Amphiura filiformis TaxID=82378 RepID=UPI003B20D499